MLKIDRHQLRVYLGHWRIHHFTAGAVLVALGGSLMFHDRHDWRDALRFR